MISNKLISKVITPPPVCDVNKDSSISLNQEGSNEGGMTMLLCFLGNSYNQLVSLSNDASDLISELHHWMGDAPLDSLNYFN